MIKEYVINVKNRFNIAECLVLDRRYWHSNRKISFANFYAIVAEYKSPNMETTDHANINHDRHGNKYVFIYENIIDLRTKV